MAEETDHPPSTSTDDLPRNGHQPKRSTLNAAVRRRRADQSFFLRLRDAIAQNHRALERLGR